MTWVAVWPALALCAVLLSVPGVVVGAAAGLRREALLGASPLLSVVALATGVFLSSRLHTAWGFLPIAVATLVLAVVAFALWLACRQFAPRLVSVAPEALTRSGLGDTLFFSAACMLGILWIAAVLIHTIGDVASVQQSFDGVFHVNAVQRVADLRSATPATVSETSNTATPAAFYPPAFHALAGLVMATTGVTAVVATNVTAVVIGSVAWVPSMALLVNVVLPRHRFGVLSGVLAAVAMPLFPALLMKFGVLWPNELSISVLPTVLALVLVVLGVPEVRSVPWASALFLGLTSVIGLYYAHPNGAFAGVALALPALLWVLVRGLAKLWRTRRFGPAWAILAAVLIWLGVRYVWFTVLALPQLKGVINFNWPATMNMAQALGTALALKSQASPATWVVAALVVLGAVQAMRHPRQRWLVLAHALLIYLYMLAAGSDEEISQELTGFWYNDQFRLSALLPVTAVPLCAIALVWVRDQLVDAFAAWYDGRPGRDRRHITVSPAESIPWQWATGALVLAALVWQLPGGLALTDVAETLRRGYYPIEDGRTLVDHDEATLYANTLAPAAAADRLRVIGNPWNGASLAGPIAHRESVYGHLVNTMDGDRKLLAMRFKDLDTDPAVCQAINRVGAGFATEDTRLFWPDDAPRRPYSYPGLDGLSGLKGLTRIGHEGTVTVYRITGCSRG